MEEHVKEVTSHAGFGQDPPSNVPGVPRLGRTTGTPQGQLLPGLWPEEQVGAGKTARLSPLCDALLASPGLAAHWSVGQGLRLWALEPSPPAPRPRRGARLRSYCWLSPLLCVSQRSHFKKCFCPVTQNKAKMERHQLLVDFLRSSNRHCEMLPPFVFLVFSDDRAVTFT